MPYFHGFKSNDPISKRTLSGNVLDVDWLSQLTVNPPLELAKTGGGPCIRFVDPTVFAKILADPSSSSSTSSTSSLSSSSSSNSSHSSLSSSSSFNCCPSCCSGHAYRWQEMYSVGDGTFDEVVNGMCGGGDTAPAYEINGLCVTPGTLVWLRPGSDGEYTFSWAPTCPRSSSSSYSSSFSSSSSSISSSSSSYSSLSSSSSHSSLSSSSLSSSTSSCTAQAGFRGQAGAAATTVSPSFTSATNAGSYLVAYVSARSGSGSTPTISAPAGWSAGPTSASAPMRVAIFYYPSAPSMTATGAFTQSGTAGGICVQLTELLTVSSWDQSGTSTGNDAAPTVSTGGTLAQLCEYEVAVWGYVGRPTGGSTTSSGWGSINAAFEPSNSTALHYVERQPSGTGVQTASLSITGGALQWCGVIMTIRSP